jgi:hypothetical protein
MDPETTPDPTPLFSNFKDAKEKNNFFLYLLLVIEPQAHYLQC